MTAPRGTAPAWRGTAPAWRETDRAETAAVTAGAALTAAAAVAGMGATGLLPAPVTVIAVLLAVVAAAGPVLWPSGEGARRRRMIATPVVAVCAVGSWVLLMTRVRDAGGDPGALVEGIGGTLSYTLAALVVVQVAAAVTVRDIATGLVGCALAALLCIGAAPDPESVDVVSAFGLCLLVGWAAGVVTMWLLHGAKDRLDVQHVMPGGGRRAWHGPALLVACSLVVALLAVALLPSPDGIRPTDPGAAGAGTGDGSRGAGGSGSRSPEGYLSGSMDLNARGELPTTELVDVPADSPPLWGGAQMDIYTGTGWRVSGLSPGAAVTRDDLGAGAVGVSLRPAPSAERADRVRPRDTGTVLPLLAPGQPVGVGIDDTLTRAPGAMLVPGSPGRPYVMRSREPVVDPVTPADTALPASLPTRVRDLAVRLTADAPTVAAKVAAIEDHLRATARYRLDSPVPDAGEDAVDDFLFESREGFCEHFAAAEAVLLRAVGVPARVVTGFAGGSDQGAVRVLRGSDAHAWVQVHAGGDQWFWSDPTAGSTLAEDADPFGALRSHGWLLGGLLLGLVLAGGAGALAVRRVRARRAAALAAAAPPTVKVLAAFAALEAALARTPLARAPELSVGELATALTRRWPGGLPDEARVSAALETVQQILYGAVAVPDDRAFEAVAVLKTLAARAPDVLPGRQPVG